MCMFKYTAANFRRSVSDVCAKRSFDEALLRDLAQA